MVEERTISETNLKVILQRPWYTVSMELSNYIVSKLVYNQLRKESPFLCIKLEMVIGNILDKLDRLFYIIGLV